ncbi:hypothetical protein NECAME_08947 [Necator americanus]|uniref:Uncharacterized protein n=1 Tax=Necator americanus TaxID=51031 RepID=W2TG43_NECAM|nr:hypothetical protein NECAME_08947 [Necator americanus]ETN80773.1 hypothetical protein NECAME_08947 [Necator americanus]
MLAALKENVEPQPYSHVSMTHRKLSYTFQLSKPMKLEVIRTQSYMVSANINKGELMYEIGNGCSNDTDCTTYPGSSCDVKSGLCSGPRSSVLTQSSSKNSTAVGVAKSNIPATKPQTEKSLSEKQASQNGTCLCYSHHNSLDLENSPSVIGLRSVNDGIMELGVVAQTQGCRIVVEIAPWGTVSSN